MFFLVFHHSFIVSNLTLKPLVYFKFSLIGWEVGIKWISRFSNDFCCFHQEWVSCKYVELFLHTIFIHWSAYLVLQYPGNTTAISFSCIVNSGCVIPLAFLPSQVCIGYLGSSCFHKYYRIFFSVALMWRMPLIFWWDYSKPIISSDHQYGKSIFCFLQSLSLEFCHFHCRDILIPRLNFLIDILLFLNYFGWNSFPDFFCRNFDISV